jgi:multidrug efflux pump subunit AcrA (membrane-fusion protein)
LFLLGSCKEANRQNASDTRDQPTRQVRVSIVRRGEILSSLTFTGTLEPFQEVKVTSKIPGRVEKVFVEEGSHVKAGAVLIELEREELALAVAQAEAAVATAEAGLAKVLAGTRKEQIEQDEAAVAQAKANRDICKVTFERMAKLLMDESIPKTRYDEAKARYDVAVAQYNGALAQLEMARTGPTEEDLGIAKAQVDQAKAALASAKRQYQNATITSPIDGIVTHKNVEPGEVVSPPMMPGKALLAIADTSSLKTMINVSENRVKMVRLGREAVIALDGFPDETFPGKVSKISPVVDPQSRTFEAEILILNPGHQLKIGMFARVQLILARRTNALIVPLKAVIEAEKGQAVFVAANGVAQVRPVTLGISDGIDVEVLSGVEIGEEVIVYGNLGLEDGDRIVVKVPRKNP